MNPERQNSTRAGDRGQASMFVLVLLVLVMVVAVQLSTNGAAAARQARAQSIADLVALAAVVHGDDDAIGVALDNGATVTSSVNDGSIHEVTIRWQGISATAAAGPDRHT